MPLAASSFAFTWSSVKREFPPSTTTSPGSRSSESSWIVCRVGSPAGIITQTTLGAARAPTSSSRLSTSRSSGLRAYPMDGVTSITQPFAHVGTHLAEPDEPDIHRLLPVVSAW